MKNVFRNIKNFWFKLSRLIRFQSIFLLFWQEPAKSFLHSYSKNYLSYDRTNTRFNGHISFWKKIFLGHYYKVFFNENETILGYKSIIKKGPFNLTSAAQRIYSLNEINEENLEKNMGLTHQDMRLDLVFHFTNSINNLPESDVYLWEIRKNFDLHHPQGKTLYFYANHEFLIEYLDKFQLRGIFVEGNNISLETVFQTASYMRKLKDFQGNYMGYDEIQNNKIRNSLRLIFNEDNVLTLTDRFALVNEKRHLRELSRYDLMGNKTSSELYEDEILQKSALFFYNEDRKLVKIIQYGPDGNILS